MAHKFHLDFGSNKYANLPMNSDFCARVFMPFFRYSFLPGRLRIWSFHFRRGISGGALLLKNFTFSFPLPTRKRRRTYKIEVS
jgi:hypothetical protein